MPLFPCIQTLMKKLSVEAMVWLIKQVEAMVQLVNLVEEMVQLAVLVLAMFQMAVLTDGSLVWLV